MFKYQASRWTIAVSFLPPRRNPVAAIVTIKYWKLIESRNKLINSKTLQTIAMCAGMPGPSYGSATWVMLKQLQLYMHIKAPAYRIRLSALWRAAPLLSDTALLKLLTTAADANGNWYPAAKETQTSWWQQTQVAAAQIAVAGRDGDDS